MDSMFKGVLSSLTGWVRLLAISQSGRALAGLCNHLWSGRVPRCFHCQGSVTDWTL